MPNLEDLQAAMELTLEQQFNLKNYSNQLSGLSREQLETFFVELLRQKMLADNMLKTAFKSRSL